ncbi:MAG: flagellar type III secretion system pore protein FliP [Abditibacteriales bacterium]|nr:flagellar type III secretion system pore protein FliP [Abditibacteriales bacterium]MDW8366759.1 flagellar type III secretion system pore protein FliP [Abditibacteriales bacterium]
MPVRCGYPLIHAIRRQKCWLASLALVLLVAGAAPAQVEPTLPKITVGIEKAKGPNDVAATLQILFVLTVLSLAPALLILTTSFVRIVLVLSFVRNALGTMQMPPNLVLIGLSLFLTFFVMAPVWKRVHDDALQPYLNSQIGYEEALRKGVKPLRQFMFRQTRDKDLALFIRLSKHPRPRTPDDVPTHVLIPAFVISELKTAFQIGFIIYIPFLIVDLVVASALMSMGMMMLPPVTISLPFKILLFVMVDGWHLIVKSLMLSFH